MLASHVPPTLHFVDFIAPAMAACVYVLVMLMLGRSTRQKFNAVMVAGFSTIYMGGGLGPWELAYVLPATYVAYKALDSYWFIALGWIMHPASDWVHHVYGNPIWPWMPTSSLGCAIFDPIVAAWAVREGLRRDRREAGDQGNKATGLYSGSTRGGRSTLATKGPQR